MISLKRPAPPVGFPSAGVVRARKELAADPRGFDLEAKANKLWGNYKRHFESCAGLKCHYCETLLSDKGHIDHFWPKSRIRALRAPGKEGIDQGVEGRTFGPVHEHAYWWHAYDWDNWVLACERCNSVWKIDLFPVAEVPHPKPDQSLPPPTPLLLNPLDPADDPMEHLVFSDIGAIAPKNDSARGKATIDTLGLDRTVLTARRAGVASLAKAMCLQATESAELASIDRAWVQLRRLGDDRSPYAGVVRALIVTLTGATWAELIARYPSDLASAP